MPQTPAPPAPPAPPGAPKRRRPATDWVSLARSGGPVHAVDPVLNVGPVRPIILAHTAPVGAPRGRTPPPRHDDAQDEAEHLQHLAVVLAHAQQVLGSETAALAWLRAPHPALDQETPQSLLATDAGMARVLRLLGRG